MIKESNAQGRDGRRQTEAPEAAKREAERAVPQVARKSEAKKNYITHPRARATSRTGLRARVTSRANDLFVNQSEAKSEMRHRANHKTELLSGAETYESEACKRVTAEKRCGNPELPKAGETRRQTAGNSPFARETPRLTRERKVQQCW